MSIKESIRKHPALAYFALTFAISWAGVLLVLGSLGPIPSPPEAASNLLGIAIIMMVPGPFAAGILVTWLASGSQGLGELRSRLFNWKVGARWYALAILTVPLLATATLLALLPTSNEFLPGIFASNDKVSLLLSGIAGGLFVAVFEELGWTGFAMPRLRERYSIIGTGLIIGLIWGVWHFLVSYWGSGDSSGAFVPTMFIPPFIFYVGVLPAYRVLMVWVNDRTGSLPVAIVMHGFLTASVPMIITPLAITWVPLSIWYLVLTAALWALAAGALMLDTGRPRRQPAGGYVA